LRLLHDEGRKKERGHAESQEYIHTGYHSDDYADILHQCPVPLDLLKAKEALFYAASVTLSLANCYMMGILLLHSTIIFAPVQQDHGALAIVVDRFLVSANIGISCWLGILVIVLIIRYLWPNFVKFTQP
jgi:hypothetical protein